MKRTRILVASVAALLLVAGGAFVALRVSMTGSGSLGGVLPGWKIIEECTPAVPGDTRGSFGSATFSAWAKPDSQFVMDNEILLETSNGSARGRITDVSVAKRADVSVAGPGQFLNVDKVMPPIWFRDDNDFLAYTYGSGTGQVASVYGIAVDPVDGGVLVGSYGTVDGVDRYKVIKYSAAGVFVTEFGSFGTSNGQFSGAQALWVAPDQSVWVTDGAGFRVQKFTTADGGLTYSYSTKVGSSGTGDGQFAAIGVPLPIAGDASGNIYVGDRGNNRIQKFNSSATFQSKVTITATSANLAPYGLAWDAANSRLYATTGQNVTSATPPVNGVVESYNSSLVLQGSTTITAPANTSYGLGNIAVDPGGGYWAHWFAATYLVHYTTAGVEDRRWYSLYPATNDTNSNMAVAVGSNGAYALFRAGTPIYNPKYEGKYVTGFDYAPVLLSEALQTYMEACDATLNGWTLDYQASEDPEVVFPGWSGNVWANLKQLFAIYGLYLGYDSDAQTFIVRDIGAETLSIENRSPVVTTPANLTGGQVVDVIYQQPTAGGGVVWDAATEGVRLSINVAETDTGILYTVNHPAELAQAVPTDTLPIQPGQYYIVDSTGTHVPAATWLEAGGNINLSVGDSPGTISRTLIGPRAAISGYTGPFYFATGTSAATGTPALSIVGNGTFCDPKRLVRAGSQGNPFNSPFMDTLDRALQRGHMPSMQDPNVTIQFTCPVSELPEVGQAAGCLVPYEQSIYRIIRVERGNLTATVTAERYVTIEDIDDTWSGETIGDFDDYWSGYSLGDIQVQPLRHD